MSEGGPRYRIVLILPNGRRKPLRNVWDNFYRAADVALFHEGRGKRTGRPVTAVIVTVKE